MELKPEIKEFIRLHLNENTDKLLLNAGKYPQTDIPFAVNQIIARRQVKEKLPDWYANDDIVYPSKISTEQCSSEITAKYKQQLTSGDRLCDLTGGLGVDACYFAAKMKEVIYTERFSEYCQCAETNFKALGINNIRILNGDAQVLAGQITTDTFYIDPARRSGNNKRVFALEDCEPNVLQLKPLLLSQAQRLIIKISPMADISETLRLLPETTEIHIISVKNECRELIFVLGKEYTNQDPLIHAVNFSNSGRLQKFSFTQKEEKNTPLRITPAPGKFLYEPNASLLKGGAFKLPAFRFNLQKLHQHSHLYTSEQIVDEFPGRSFRIEDVYEFSGKLLKQLSKTIPQANLTTRNFNLTVAELRKRSKITEGGNIYLFATTLNENQVIIKCERI